MHGKEENGFVVLKLNDGEDLFGCLKRAIGEFGIKSGIIVSGIGMLRDIEIGYFQDGAYEWKTYEKPHELIAFHGSISTAGEEVIHIHCGLAGPEHQLIGGHLNSAKVCVLNEILIRKFETITFERVLSESSGLKELRIS